MIQLAGTGLLADDLYLLAHHDVSGRPFLQARALGLGLAGGLLAELVLAGRIRVVPHVLVADRTLPQDGLECSVLGLLLGEREPHEVRQWLAFFSRGAVQGVAERLAGSGYLVREPGRLLRADRWVPADSDCAFAPLIRARTVLDRARQPGVPDVVLAGAGGGVRAGLAGAALRPARRSQPPGCRGAAARRGPAGADRPGAGGGRRRLAVAANVMNTTH